MEPVDEFTKKRRNLPHWQLPGSIYFLTWRCAVGRVLDPEDRTVALNAIRFWDNRRWTVIAVVIMPDHVHVMVRPLPIPNSNDQFHSLSDLLESVKGFSARAINKRQNRSGPVWQDERFDRIVRDDEEFQGFREYIVLNPVKAGLVTKPEEYTWLYLKSPT